MVCVHMRPDITSVKCLIKKDFNVQDFDVYIHGINLYITLVHMCMYLV